MPAFALEALGLENATPLPPSKWGIAFRKVEELGHIREGIVLHIEPFHEAERLFATPLWQAMPFVREGRFRALPPVWTYGGAMSIGYLAEAIAAVLTGGEPG
jgi:iron complex transport system substrate-binding protein